MNVALAGTPSEYTDILCNTNTKISVLVSYWYLKDQPIKLGPILDKCKATDKKFYLDSGVFTARKKNFDIKLEDLIKFCRMYENRIDHVFNLDMGSYDTQLNNCRQMLKNNIPCIGIISNKMSFDEIKRFIDTSPYIGLSYIKNIHIATKGNDYEYYLENVFEYLYKNNYKDVKTHALGLTKYDMLKKFPFYSVDSSTWINPFRFGVAFKFENGQFHSFSHKEKGSTLRNGGTNIALQHHAIKSKHDVIKHSAQAFYDMQEFLTKLWTKRGVIWDK
jgi:hypothetical protein